MKGGKRPMRKAGILLHISSLPSKCGIGNLGEEAYKFVDFLKDAGQTYWQVLPLCPTNFGDSPYQSNSVFAGNPYFIDLETLKDEGLLSESEIDNYFFGSDESKIDYKRLFDNRYPILRQAFSRFERDEQFFNFEKENAFWLDDYALFMSIKEHNHFCSWDCWEKDIYFCNEDKVGQYRENLSRSIEFYKFIQYKFYEQWYALKEYANNNGIKIIGDMPIYVAFDSAEVWRHPELFELDENKKPVSVAGCPPDAFSEKGQLWGNPLYDWEYHKNTGYDWWIKRVNQALKVFDRVRVDHFRGFAAYYSIPFGREDATLGEWRKGPGIELFNRIRNSQENPNIIAEDLGFLDNDVHELLRNTGYPGMRVLQFAFNPHEDNMYLPHNIEKNSVVYTGTHDNDTFIGWYEGTSGEEKEFAKRYLGISHKEDAGYAGIRAVFATKAETAIIPIQDYLKKGSVARMNTPATTSDNWQYRIIPGELTSKLSKEIYDITKAFRRL